LTNQGAAVLTATQQTRIAGLCLVVGGTLAVLWGAAHFLPAGLLSAGLLGLNARQSTGIVGRVGWLILIAGLLLGAGFELVGWLSPAALAANQTGLYLVDGLAVMAGMVIYGFATFRAGRFRGGELLVIGPLSIVVLGTWGARLGAVGFVVLGIYLLKER
jgi:hypothetical protein